MHILMSQSGITIIRLNLNSTVWTQALTHLSNLSYRYIDDLISFNNKKFKEFIFDIYPKELTISETTESTSIAY